MSCACTGFSWLLGPDVSDELSLIPVVEDIIYSPDFLHSKLDPHFFLQKMALDEMQISKVVQQTVSQRVNPMWHMLVLTMSVFFAPWQVVILNTSTH